MLKDKYDHPEKEWNDKVIMQKRTMALYSECLNTFPQEIDAQISMGSLSKHTIRAFIYIPKDAPQEITEKCKEWLLRFGKPEKNLREDEGRFYWLAKRKHEAKIEEWDENQFEEMVFIENAHNEHCELVKVKKQVEVFEARCEELK